MCDLVLFRVYLIDKLCFRLVTGLGGKVVVQASCGHGDAHTLVLCNDGKVFSFGDSDYGKLGRGKLSHFFVFLFVCVCVQNTTI